MCDVQKKDYLSTSSNAQPRVNDPATSLFPYSFVIAERCFCDPLHCGKSRGTPLWAHNHGRLTPVPVPHAFRLALG